MRRTSATRSEFAHQRGATTNTYLLALFLLVVGVLLAIYLNKGSDTPGSANRMAMRAAIVELPPEARLNPALFRGQIVALETALGLGGSVGDPDIGEISRAVLQLADTLQADGGSIALRVAPALYDFAHDLDQFKKVGFSNLDLPAVREHWFQLRSGLFKPANWYASDDVGHSGDLEPGATDSRSELVNDFRVLTMSISDLAMSGRDETSYFGEIGVDVANGSDAAAALTIDWNEWAKGWNHRVEYLAASLPAAPSANAEPELATAHKALATAIHQLRLVAMSDTGAAVPSRTQRTRWFDAADAEVEKARINLSGL